MGDAVGGKSADAVLSWQILIDPGLSVFKVEVIVKGEEPLLCLVAIVSSTV